MIANFKPGLKHDVSLSQCQATHRSRLANAKVAHAKYVSRRLANVLRFSIQDGFLTSRNAFDNGNTLEDVCIQYGCHPALIPYAIDCAKDILQRKGLVV